MIRVLHLTAHLGGGVGRALSGLAQQAQRSRGGIEHVFICLERPEKTQFVDRIRQAGVQVVVMPDSSALLAYVQKADIVQLEWWNHPATLHCLCSHDFPPMRLLVWCHVSGLYTPKIPDGLMHVAQRLLFTSPCSFQAPNMVGLSPVHRMKLGVVASCPGFCALPGPEGRPEALSVGYVGSLNFAKLHPAFVEFLAGVDIPGLQVRLVGDLTNQEKLQAQCAALNKPELLDFRGYVTDVAAELSALNVMAYLLNPEHYGTTENALLETMAMGIVPIVLDHPAERHIVQDGKTGLVVGSQEEFASAMRWLAAHPQERLRLGHAASAAVRARFSAASMETSFYGHYQQVMRSDKRPLAFRHVFGPEPVHWFLACQSEPQFFGLDGQIHRSPGSATAYAQLEKTKGTVFHFRAYFPNEPLFEAWSQQLATDPLL